MLTSTSRLLTLAVAAALAVAGCGGDDVSDVVDSGEASADADADVGSDSDSDVEDTSSDDSGPGFGEFVTGTVTLSGAEDAVYTVDDPAYTMIGAGGCAGGSFGITVNAAEAETGFTALQVSAQIAEDLSGGGTGTFDVEDVSVFAVTDGDIAAGRSYDGPGTITIAEHDTGGPSADLNARRMAITLEGTLVGTGDTDGEVEVAADVVWVMGCP